MTNPRRSPPTCEPLLEAAGEKRRVSLNTNVRDNVRTMTTDSTTASPTSRREAAPTQADPAATVGPRINALRDAMGLSLRDLAERSGVSAPMLSQVERGETSPTLAVADEDRRRPGADAVAAAAPRRGPARRRQPRRRAPPLRARRPPLRGADAAAARASAPTSRCTRWSRAPPPAAAPTRRCTSRAAARPRSSSTAPWRCSSRAPATTLPAGDSVTFDADLPHHFENDGEEPTRFIAVIAAGLRRS